MPYALFCPSGMSASAPSAPVHGLGLADIGVFPGQAGTKETSTKREFAWGSADVWNGEHSDLGKLRESIFEINTRVRSLSLLRPYCPAPGRAIAEGQAMPQRSSLS